MTRPRTVRANRGNVTLQDIADACGVAKATVSYALGGNRQRVSEATFNRIHAAARELGYDAHSQHAARRLSMRKGGKEVLNHLVALMFPRNFVQLPYYMKIFRGIMDVLSAERFGLLMHYDNSGGNTELLPVIARGEVDGAIILANPFLFEPMLSAMRDTVGFGDRPVTSLMNPMSTCSSVRAADRQGARDAVAHLLELGHRQIMHFYHDPHKPDTNWQRLQGCRDALRRGDLAPAGHLHSCFWSHDHRDQDEAAINGMLDAHPEITAVLAPNDHRAGWIHEILVDRGLRVPDDISMIGFDDTHEISGAGNGNILTTVRVPLEDIGRRAARLVLDAVHGKYNKLRQEVLPTELIVRGTTAKAKTT